jgi:chromosome partitioning protein
MIIVAGGIKGGSGKSTVATNLVVMRAADSRDVLLVDADDQETATDFTAHRNERTNGQAGYTSIRLSGAAVRTEVQRLKGKYDDIIIDTGGRDTTSQRAAMAVADVLLIPFVPRSFDIWTLERVAALVDEMRPANPELKAFVFLNRADPQGRDNDDANEALADVASFVLLDTPLGSRKAFANAAAEGKAVTELSPRNDQAVAEVTTLYERVFNVISTSDAV